MGYALTPPSAVMTPVITTGLGGATSVPQMELNEPVSGAGMTSTVGGTVNVVKTTDPMVVDPATYTIHSVACDNIGEFVNGGSDLSIIINTAKTSFTFKSSFLDLFDRQYRYTKTFEPLEASWRQVNLVNPKFTFNGTTTVKITIDNSLPMRVGEEITLANGLAANEKALKGTWPITSVGGNSASYVPQENEAFTTATIKVNKPISQATNQTAAYNTFHTAARARYVVKGLDSNVKIDDFHGVYEMNYPPEARLITFTVVIKRVGGIGDPTGGTLLTNKWSFKYFSNFNQTMRLLELGVNRGEEAVQNKSVYGNVAPQGYISLDDSIITSDSVSISLNGITQYEG